MTQNPLTQPDHVERNTMQLNLLLRCAEDDPKSVMEMAMNAVIVCMAMTGASQERIIDEMQGGPAVPEWLVQSLRTHLAERGVHVELS